MRRDGYYLREIAAELGVSEGALGTWSLPKPGVRPEIRKAKSLAAEGWTTKEIAAEVGVAARTIQNWGVGATGVRQMACAACGIEFRFNASRAGRRKYCPEECRTNSQRRRVPCRDGCGRTVRADRKTGCCRPCAARRAVRRAPIAWRDRRRPTVRCACGNPAERRPSGSLRHHDRLCRACYEEKLKRACPWCHEPFKAATRQQKYCSDHCNNVAKKKRRQALKRSPGAKPPSIGYIIRRDRGICQLCGDKVDPAAKWPDGRMPSMDHIVPLSEGGSDSARNIQLAHLSCNISKQDHRCGSQLRLVG